MAHAPKAKATGTADEGSFLTGLFGDILGGAEVEVEWLGDKIKKFIPDSIRRSNFIRRALGILKQRVEKHGYKVGGKKGQIISRLTDVADFAFQGGEVSHDQFEEWKAQLLNSVLERMAKSKNKAEVIAEAREELRLYQDFYYEVKGGKPEAHEDVDWDSVHAELGRLALDIQRRFPETRPKPVARASASGLPLPGGRYDNSQSGGRELAETLGRGAEAVYHNVQTGIIAAACIMLVNVALIVFSLVTGFTAGLVASLLIFVLCLFYVVAKWPVGGTAALIALVKWGPRGPWKFVMGFFGVLLLLGIVFLLWNPDWDVKWRHALVLSVAAVSLLIGAGLLKLFKGIGGGHDGDHSSKGVNWVMIALAVVAVLYLAGWRPSRTPNPPPPASQTTHTAIDGEDWTMTSKDVLVTIPAGTTEGACIRRTIGVRNFWTQSPNGEFQVQPGCKGRWRTESPAQSIDDGQLFAGMGVRNPSDEDVTVWFRAR